MQSLPAPINPAQLYQQTKPGLLPAAEQLQTPMATGASLPDAFQPSTQPVAAEVQPTPPTTSTSSNIPDASVVQTQLANAKAVPIGLKYGLIFGSLGALPIWGIEKGVSKVSKERAEKEAKKLGIEPNFKPQPNFIQQLVLIGEQARGSVDMKWSKKLATKMEENLAYSYLGSAAGTVMVGAITGGTLGWWSVKHIKDKLNDINKMKNEQQAGVFQPKRPTMAQRLGLAKPPTNDPEQDYQNLLQTNLDQTHAFKNGAYDVAMVKVLPGVGFLALLGSYLGYAKWRGINNEITKMVSLPQVNESVKAMFHPVLLAKLLAIPALGGLIAKQIVPWAKGQLNISANGEAIAQPGKEPTPLAAQPVIKSLANPMAL